MSLASPKPVQTKYWKERPTDDVLEGGSEREVGGVVVVEMK